MESIRELAQSGECELSRTDDNMYAIVKDGVEVARLATLGDKNNLDIPITGDFKSVFEALAKYDPVNSIELS